MDKAKTQQQKINGKKKYSWSKWGGGNHGLVTQNIIEKWFCQICGEVQPKGIEPYRMEFYTGEYLRICHKCYSKVLKGKKYIEIKRVVNKRIIISIANKEEK